jgi:hypothetical protein
VTDTPARRRWRIIDVAKKEFAELPKAGKQGLTELMARVRRGDDVLPREVGHYGNGLKGLKYSEGHNEFRAYYSPEGEEGQVPARRRHPTDQRPPQGTRADEAGTRTGTEGPIGRASAPC